ncbi:MAG: esterase family protein [Blautia sp.]|nr:esterase family protein [Blautia sp.]
MLKTHRGIRRFFFSLLGIFLLHGFTIRAENMAVPYEVILPENYEQETERSYPVVYVLPDDGKAGADEAMLEGLTQAFSTPDAMDTIVVIPDLSGYAAEDLYSVVSGLVSDVDEAYHTIADSSGRAAAGAYEGGALAYLLTYRDENGRLLKQPSLFGMTGAVCPSFTTESEFTACYGSFTDFITRSGLNNAIATQFFTFLRTPTEAVSSFEKGGANDVIAAFIQKGAAYGGFYDTFYGNADNTVLDLTIPHGEDDDVFRTQAGREMAMGFSRRIMSGLVSGALRISPQAAKADAESIEAIAGMTFTPEFYEYLGEKEGELTFIYEMSNPADGSSLTDAVEVKGTLEEAAAQKAAVTALPNLVEQESSQITLKCRLLGAEILLDTKPLVRINETGTTPEEQFVDLMGEWKFKAETFVKAGSFPDDEEIASWEEVIPCLGWWNDDFSKVTQMRAFAGYAWYVKDFSLPGDFPEGTYVVPLGGFDETDIVWINGEQIGCTGLNADTWDHEEDKWDTTRVYQVDSSVLHIGGDNRIMVLTHNASGDGGWYGGHPGIYTETAYAAKTSVQGGEENTRFLSVTIPSAHKAAAVGSANETEDENFLVYLPEGYDDEENAGKRYPTAYLFHQLNSSGNSYVIDGIDRLLDQGIADGRIRELIVIIPDSAPESWWAGGWDTMVTEEILPYVDENFRTIPDAAHRFTAGASMGGHGSYYIGLSHPELFSGIISYFGAINMGANPLGIAKKAEKGFLAGYSHYFVCGNRDLYKFGIPAIQLDQLLREQGVEHYFELGEGEHDSAFYVPYVIDSFSYMTQRMGE